MERFIEKRTKIYISCKEQVTEVEVGDYLLHNYWEGHTDPYEAAEVYIVTGISLEADYQYLKGSPILELYWLNPHHLLYNPHRAETITRLDWYNYFHYTRGKSENWFKLHNLELAAS